MSRSAASPLLRESLLEGVSIVLARAHAEGEGGGEDSPSRAVRALCASLGARVSDCPLSCHQSPEEEEAALDAAVAAVLAEVGAIDMLVIDAAGLFSARDSLVGVMESSWNVTRAVVNQAYLESGRPGRVVYLAPPPDAGARAGAVCAGLENLARTLSIEWARHAVTPVTIAPAGDTDAEQVATLTAYLASPAGAYFSGCLLDLTGPAGTGSAGTGSAGMGPAGMGPAGAGPAGAGPAGTQG
jgi:NAD(P)-dependent dehydrogenase (short-subunit alcohol dehydrogenase family)